MMILRKKKRRPAGFTLIEMILVTAIVAVLTVSLYQALAMGINIWKRSQMFSAEENIMIFLDKITKDLSNAMDFSLFTFEGTDSTIKFTAIVSVPMGRWGGPEVDVYAPQIGRVEYGQDPEGHFIYRRQANYGQATHNQFGAEQQLTGPVESLSFKYFSRTKKGLVPLKLSDGLLPEAVEVSVQYLNSYGHPQTMTRLINLPLRL